VPVPAIAIHGSGDRSEIARAVDGNFKDSTLYDRVVTLAFDWGTVTPESSYKGAHDLYRFLKRHAANIGAASRVGLDFGLHSLERLVGALQVQVHRLLQAVLSALVAMLFATLVAKLVVLAPAAWLGLPTITLSPMRWLATAVSWTQVALAAGITLLIALAGLRLLLTMSARPVAVTFRSIVLLLLQPVLVITLGAFAAAWWLLLAIFTFLVVLSYFAAGVAAALLWAGALAAVITLRMLWARGSLPGPLKVALEAFRYLGEPRYRERIQQALDKAIVQARTRIGNEQDFVLVAQGIGTVIALDSVSHSRVWRKTDRVLLVTMGSPLRRWFLTLYPGTLFPERMESVVDFVVRRLSELRWVNIYRPWDYLGAALDLKPFSGRDITTGIGQQRFFGHTDYWRDIDARRTFQHGLLRLKNVKPRPVARRESVHELPKPRGAAEFRIPALARTLLRTGVVLATVGWMLWWVATGSGVLVSGVEGPSELLERRGVVVEAAVTHRRETVENNLGVTYVDHWVFAFRDSSGVARRLKVERDASDAHLGIAPPGFDPRTLTRRIRAACSDTWPPDWWPMGNVQASCTLEGVRLRYYTGDLAVLDLPDFQPRRFGREPVRGWTEAGVAAAMLSVLVLIPFVLGLRVFGVLLGLSRVPS
jgi:hypothetical protein